MTEEVKSLIELKPMPKIDKLINSSSFENVSTKLQEINNLLKVSSNNLKIIMDANYLMYESTDKFTDLVQKLNDKPNRPSTLMRGNNFRDKISSIPNIKNIKEIKFIKDTPNPNGIDVSEAQDKSIMASLDGGTVLTIACNNEIIANKYCSCMFDTSSVSSTLGMGNINKICFDNFNTKNVIDMSYMFYRMATLTDFLNFKDINTKNVTNMSGMFRECTKLQSIDFSNIDLSNVTDISSMFQDCSSLQSINGLDKLELKKVTNYAAAFLRCNKLNGEITISNHSIINYINMFYDCSIEPNTKFTVNYIDEETKKIVEQMVATKSPESNVILGKLVTQ